MPNTAVKVQYLPNYSPDLRPDEHLNCDLKNGLSKKPDKISKYFTSLHISCASRLIIGLIVKSNQAQANFSFYHLLGSLHPSYRSLSS